VKPSFQQRNNGSSPRWSCGLVGVGSTSWVWNLEGTKLVLMMPTDWCYWNLIGLSLSYGWMHLREHLPPNHPSRLLRHWFLCWWVLLWSHWSRVFHELVAPYPFCLAKKKKHVSPLHGHFDLHAFSIYTPSFVFGTNNKSETLLSCFCIPKEHLIDWSYNSWELEIICEKIITGFVPK
jgi:hypothetical protein